MIYKYLPPERTEFLSNFSFRFTQPSDLNDPIDCRPLISYKDPEKHINYLIRRNRGRVVEALLQNYPGTSRQQAEEATRSFATEFREEFHRNVDARREHDIGLLMRGMSQILGVLSLTKNPCNQVMWTHYAGNGRGYLIGLDEHHAFFSRQPEDRADIGALRPVVYSDTPVEIVLDLPDIPMRIDMLYTKRTCWSYEGEYRLVRELAHATTTNPNLSGHPIHLFEIPQDAVKEFVLGYQVDEAVARKIDNAANRAGSSAKIKRAGVNLTGSLELI